MTLITWGPTLTYDIDALRTYSFIWHWCLEDLPFHMTLMPWGPTLSYDIDALRTYPCIWQQILEYLSPYMILRYLYSLTPIYQPCNVYLRMLTFVYHKVLIKIFTCSTVLILYLPNSRLLLIKALLINFFLWPF